jgi:23S rRNA (guanosine2251-2'-O)-methyltransferase
MPTTSFEIRVCLSCHLRYPLTEGHPFGVRCPQCLGETKAVLKKEINEEIEEPENRQGTSSKKRKAVLLDNIRSAWNAGSILRSADGFGFSHAYLCGITPTPEVETVQKTSLGAEDYVTWSYHPNALQLVKGLKKEGWTILALEEDERAITLAKGKKSMSEKSVLIVGNEVTGVDPELLDLSDHILHIPMHGKKRSFNVANAFSVAAYALGS